MDAFLREYLNEFGGATDSHDVILSELQFSAMKYRKEYYCFRDNIRLVYLGEKKDYHSLYLAPSAEYLDEDLLELEYIEPDFTLFNKNACFRNKTGSRIAGQPLLAVEVWSKSNLKSHRSFKKYLYSTSSITEHWYIEQDSDLVECYLHKTQLPSQYLNNPLKTSFGLVLDLTAVCLVNRDLPPIL